MELPILTIDNELDLNSFCQDRLINILRDDHNNFLQFIRPQRFNNNSHGSRRNINHLRIILQLILQINLYSILHIIDHLNPNIIMLTSKNNIIVKFFTTSFTIYCYFFRKIWIGRVVCCVTSISCVCCTGRICVGCIGRV